MTRWIPLVALLLLAADSAPGQVRLDVSVGDVPVTGVAPATSGDLDAVSQVVKEGRRIARIDVCHRKTLKLVSGGRVFDKLKRDECVSSAKEKILARLAGLVPRRSGERADVALPCVASELGGAEPMLDTYDVSLMRTLARVYCCGTEPLPDVYSGYVPDPSGDPACQFKTLDKVSKSLEKFGKSVLACHDEQIPPVVGEDLGSVGELEVCEALAVRDLEDSVNRIPALPLCVEDNMPGMAEDILDLYRRKSDQVLCQGSEEIDPRGCCSRTLLPADSGDPYPRVCSNVADQASCEAGFAGNAPVFVPGGICNDETGACEPTTCDLRGVCDPGEDCLNCPSNCGPCGASCFIQRCRSAEAGNVIATCAPWPATDGAGCDAVDGYHSRSFFLPGWTCNLDSPSYPIYPVPPTCGSPSTCDGPEETCRTCEQDCGPCTGGDTGTQFFRDSGPQCGDGICQPAQEDPCDCPCDCPGSCAP